MGDIITEKSNSTSNEQKTKNLPIDISKNNKINPSNLPIVSFSECKNNEICKISERKTDRLNTFVKRISDKELLFIGGSYHYSSKKMAFQMQKQLE